MLVHDFSIFQDIAGMFKYILMLLSRLLVNHDQPSYDYVLFRMVAHKKDGN